MIKYIRTTLSLDQPTRDRLTDLKAHFKHLLPISSIVKKAIAELWVKEVAPDTKIYDNTPE